MIKTLVRVFAAAGVVAVCSEKGRQALAWPSRKLQLERDVTYYLAESGGALFDKEARTRAREAILDDPSNPFNPEKD